MMEAVSTQRLFRDTIGRVVKSDAGHEGGEVDVVPLAALVQITGVKVAWLVHVDPEAVVLDRLMELCDQLLPPNLDVRIVTGSLKL